MRPNTGRFEQVDTPLFDFKALLTAQTHEIDGLE